MTSEMSPFPHFHGQGIQWASILIGSFRSRIHSIIRQSIKLCKSESWMSLIWNLATFEQSVHLHISMQQSLFLRQEQLVVTHIHPHFTSSRTALGAGSFRHMVGRYTPSKPRFHPFISSARRTGFAIAYELSLIDMYLAWTMWGKSVFLVGGSFSPSRFLCQNSSHLSSGWVSKLLLAELNKSCTQTFLMGGTFQACQLGTVSLNSCRHFCPFRQKFVRFHHQLPMTDKPKPMSFWYTYKFATPVATSEVVPTN